jgi:hypothetical protein
MARPPKLAFVEKNSGLLIEEMLQGGIDPDGADLEQILELCMHYRRVGICRWLTRGDADALFTELANSAWVFTAWLARHPADEQCTARLDPFLDAVAAGADQAASAIRRQARGTWNEDGEYEEDFCYARILQHLACSEVAEAAPLLERWSAVSGSGEPRHQVCAAILARDPEAFVEGLTLLLDQVAEEIGQRRGKGDPDAAVTTDRLSLEGLALLKLARRHGITSTPTHLLIHAALLVPAARALPGADDWKTIESHGDLA